MLKRLRNLVYILVIALFSCSSDSSDRSTSKDKSYNIENIVFYNEQANIRIAGTLTYPEDEGPFPAVVLIPGSGNTTRDGSDNQVHRPLFEIADYLSKHGFAVLRCDKRGAGESEGVLDFNTTIADLAGDVKASIDFLCNKPITDTNKLGLIGHSKGGLVAAKVAADMPALSFVVLMACPGIKHGDILRQQLSDIPGAFGINDKTIKEFQIIIDSTMIILTSGENDEITAEMVEEMYRKRMDQITDNEIESMSKTGYIFQRDAQMYSSMVMTPFWYEFYTLDPKTIFNQVNCPVLSITGENDMQVRPEPNQAAIKIALESGNNYNYALIIPEGMNHLFQMSDSGSPGEYYKTKDTMSESVLDTINNWILKQVNN